MNRRGGGGGRGGGLQLNNVYRNSSNFDNKPVPRHTCTHTMYTILYSLSWARDPSRRFFFQRKVDTRCMSVLKVTGCILRLWSNVSYDLQAHCITYHTSTQHQLAQSTSTVWLRSCAASACAARNCKTSLLGGSIGIVQSNYDVDRNRQAKKV